MRIFHLIKGLGRGGAETLLVAGLRQADRARFEFAYGYLLPWKEALAPELRAAGAEVRCLPAAKSWQLPGAVFAVARWLRRGRADLLHSHLPVAGAIGRLAGRLAGVPVVTTEHNLQERYHAATRWANRLTWRLQRQAIAVSAGVAESIARHLPGSVPVEVVLNGIEVERFALAGGERLEAKRALGIPSPSPVIGAVAVFRTQKRLDLWLEAARIIGEARPDARFLLVGDGPLAPEVKARARELGLKERLLLPGLQPEVRPYLAAMDLWLASSDFEGLPLALLEAMAAGIPPVATAVGGVPEVLDESCGRLVAPGDAAALAREALALLGEEERRRSLGNAARQRVAERFSMARMQRQLETIYQRILERGA